MLNLNNQVRFEINNHVNLNGSMQPFQFFFLFPPLSTISASILHERVPAKGVNGVQLLLKGPALDHQAIQ